MKAMSTTQLAVFKEAHPDAFAKLDKVVSSKLSGTVWGILGVLGEDAP